jgi:hypothetical protein
MIGLFEHIDVEFRDEYFGAPQEREQYTSGSESHQEGRRKADKSEMIHLPYLTSGQWERFWGQSFVSTGGSAALGKFLKEVNMNVMFLHYFALHAGRTIAVQTYALICLPY